MGREFRNGRRDFIAARWSEHGDVLPQGRIEADDIPTFIAWLQEGSPKPKVRVLREAQLEMVHDLHRAVYGDSWARPESAATVWAELLAKVAKLREACEGLRGDLRPSSYMGLTVTEYSVAAATVGAILLSLAAMEAKP